MTTHLLVIYDDGRGRFGPMTGLRAAFDIRSGARSGISRIEALIGQTAKTLIVPEKLTRVTASRWPDRQVNPDLTASKPCLLINGRWLGTRFLDEVNQLIADQAIVQADGQVIAACLNGNDASRFLGEGGLLLSDQTRTVRVRQRALIDRPWHILDELTDILTVDLAEFTYPPIEQSDHQGITVIGDHPVRIAPGVKIMPPVVFDASQGPVVLDRDAVVNPFVVIQGPCYIGPGTEIASHASIRQNTALGERCKIGGEVSFSIIDSYTNKAHAGYLGHSLIGSWSNLGAGTNASNLKNTYGHVRVQLDEAAAPEDTGRTFQGTIVGDYVRTAIGTRLPTGSVIHTGCMLATSGWAPRFAAPFGFYTDQNRQAYDLEKLIATIKAMKDRRSLTLNQSEEAMIRSLVRP